MTVTFNTEIAAFETPAFRGAVIQKVGIEHDFYHNHNNDPEASSAYFYRYPLIQYKRRGKKPMLVFLDSAVEEATRFLGLPSWDLTIGDKTHQLEVSSLEVRPALIGVTEDEHYYTLRRWIALNDENYSRYRQLEGLSDRISCLENILAANILGFATGIGVRFKERFEVKIIEILGERLLPFSEEAKLMAFDIRFKANVQLPSFIGLGKGSGRGYGVLQVFKKRQNENNNDTK